MKNYQIGGQESQQRVDHLEILYAIVKTLSLICVHFCPEKKL